MSVPSAERISGHHCDTITRSLVLVGEKCEVPLDRLLVAKLILTHKLGRRSYNDARRASWAAYLDPAKVCTSQIEWEDLTVRMHLRRLTRLKNSFLNK